ncbi:MAG: hypothetical protein IKP73_04180 [Bacteroidales bacterium]|jgi:hypothetical protein|nr:hypothetical protein [Bacteroidales bacterium]
MDNAPIHQCLSKLYSLLKTGTKQDLYNKVATHYRVSASRVRKWLSSAKEMPHDEARTRDIYAYAFQYLDTLLQSQYAPDRSRIAAIDATTDYIRATLLQPPLTPTSKCPTASPLQSSV